MALSIGAHADVVRGILKFACDELLLPKGMCWCDSPDMHSEEIPYFVEEQWMQAIQERPNGLLMASGAALSWSGRDETLQISSPTTDWHGNPYKSGFMGFRGAMNLMDLWCNALIKRNKN